MANDQSNTSDDSNQQTEQGMDPAIRAMLEQQQSENFWQASVDRESVKGPTYMRDYYAHYSTIDADHVQFLIMITSVVVTLVFSINALLSTYTGLAVPASIQVSGTIAVITVVDYFRGPNSDSEDGEIEPDG